MLAERRRASIQTREYHIIKVEVQRQERLYWVCLKETSEYKHHEHSHNTDHHTHDKTTHYHHFHNHHDNHHHGNESEDCLISETPVIISRNQDLDFFDDNTIDTQQYLCFMIHRELIFPEVSEIQTISNRCRANIPPGTIVRSHGLRAPPLY